VIKKIQNGGTRVSVARLVFSRTFPRTQQNCRRLDPETKSEIFSLNILVLAEKYTGKLKNSPKK